VAPYDIGARIRILTILVGGQSVVFGVFRGRTFALWLTLQLSDVKLTSK